METSTACSAGTPPTDIDPWDDDGLSDLYSTYRTLRDLGAVVWLERNDIAATIPFDGVRLAQGHMILAEFADRVERFEFVGETRWQINNALHGPSYHPLRIIPA